MDRLTLDRRGLLSGLLAAAAAGAAAPSPGFARAATRYAALESLIERSIAADRVPGAIVAIVRPGRFRPDYVMAGRTARNGEGRPVAPDSLWRIYSMTKPVTGVATVEAVARGAFTLDTPLGDLLPEYRSMRVLTDPAASLDSRPAEAPIRVRHLLTHTAGLSYHIAGNGPLEREYRRLGLLPIGNLGLLPTDGPQPDLDGFTRTLATLPLHGEPGTAWRYSVGLDLAGGLLQRVTGQSFDRLLAERLFRPLGMADTGFQVPAADLPRLAHLYAFLDPKTQKPTETPQLVETGAGSLWAKAPRLVAGGAGLVSSAADYARFAQMLLNEGLFEGRRILPAPAARLAMSNLMPPGVFLEKMQGHGAGGRVTLFDTRGTRPDGTPAGQFGWGGAAGTLFHVDPLRQYAVVLMLQYLPSQAFPMPAELQGALNADLA
ncbi:MAG: serine hydrolase domain-containing protein [Sphingomonadaceae bacterium]